MLLARLQNYTLKLKADLGKFLLAGLHCQIHLNESIEERHLWVRPCFSSSAPKFSFYHTWMVLQKGISGHTTVISWSIASRNKSLKHQRSFGLIGRVFANDPELWGSIPGRVTPKTQNMVLDAALLNTQHYKIKIKGKVEQPRVSSCTLPYTSVW